MNKVLIFLGCLLASPVFAQEIPAGTKIIGTLSVDDTPSCSDVDNYAAQYKVKEVLHKDSVFSFDGMSMKDLGNEHWYIRVKLNPWASQIKDVCVRNETLSYLRAESLYLEQEVHDRKTHKVDALEDDLHREGRLQDKGQDKMNKMEWPKVP